MLRLLQVKFTHLPKVVRDRIEGGTDPDFERWTERFVTAETLDQVFDDSPLD